MEEIVRAHATNEGILRNLVVCGTRTLAIMCRRMFEHKGILLNTFCGQHCDPLSVSTNLRGSPISIAVAKPTLGSFVATTWASRNSANVNPPPAIQGSSCTNPNHASKLSKLARQSEIIAGKVQA